MNQIRFLKRGMLLLCLIFASLCQAQTINTTYKTLINAKLAGLDKTKIPNRQNPYIDQQVFAIHLEKLVIVIFLNLLIARIIYIFKSANTASSTSILIKAVTSFPNVANINESHIKQIKLATKK